MIDLKAIDPAELVAEARERFHECATHDRENREHSQSDLRFLSGEQWAEKDKNARDLAGRPTLTINRLPQFVAQVINDIRLNKPAITVRPVDSVSDPKLADTLTGLIRNIEEQSDADTAYVTAAEHAISCGLGHFRITTEYVSDDAFEQDIRIRPIHNPFSVVWDAESRALTREDARFCFVLSRVGRKAFEARFPDASTTGFDGEAGISHVAEWFTRDTVQVAEYWVKIPYQKILLRAPTGEVLDATDMPGELLAQAQAEGGRIRTVDCHKVVMWLLNGHEVLSGPHMWPGKHIPIIPVIGKEFTTGERVLRAGLVRYAKDAQASYNYFMSALVESVALTPKAPYLATPAQIDGFEDVWAKANTDNLPYLPYNPDPQAAAPARQPPPMLSPAIVSLIQFASEDLKSTTGIYDAALGARSNETSGRAIIARQREGDVSTFVFIDNLSKAIAHAGRQLVDLIPRIYDTERVVRVLGEDGSAEMKPINIEIGEGKRQHDLAAGKYDVVVKAGPSFSTRREETVRSILEFVQACPPAAPLVGDMLAENMDWPRAKEIGERLKSLMPPGIAETAAAKAKGEEPPPLPPPPPPPEAVEAERRAELEQAKLHLAAQESAQRHALDVARLQFDQWKAQQELEIKAAQIGAQPEKAAVAAPTINLGESVGREVAAGMSEVAQRAEAASAQSGEAMASAIQGLAAAVQAMQASAQSIEGAARMMAAPKEVVRDKGGRVVGVVPAPIQ